MEVSVQAEINRGHSVEFYADRICGKLLHVSDTAPVEIRAQALAYQERIRDVVLDGLQRAVMSDRTTVAARLRLAGMSEAAVFVLGMGK